MDKMVSWAIKRAATIVGCEGAELALSARQMDEAAIEADSTLLATAIVNAALQAYLMGVSGMDPDDWKP